MNKKLQALIASYLRSVVGAAVTLYMSGVTDPKTLAYSLVGAIVPVALRAVNPKDTAFGRMPSVAEVEAAVKDVKPVSAPVAKATTRKTVAKKTAPKK